MRRSNFAIFGFLSLLLPALACQDGSPDPTGLGDLGEGLKVLFIGNSLTASNDLPELVQVVAEATGHEIAVRVLAVGTFSLEEHWARGEAREMIRAADWDVVVLQQGPSSLSLDKIRLKAISQRFDTIVRAQGARSALFMVWPEADRPASFDAVTAAYTQAADAVGGMLLPVGEAWRAAWRVDPALGFYGPDGFHPTQLGSILGALVIFQQLFDETPVGLPATLVPMTEGLRTLSIPLHLNFLLQEAAAEANRDFGRR